MNRILVIGGTGNVGREVVAQLSARRATFRVMARKPAGSGLPADIDVVAGDLTAPDTLANALSDVDAVFLVWVAPPEAAPAAMERIARHARRIVFLTAPLKTPHPFFQQPNRSRDVALGVERLIEDSGIAWTFIRAGMFAGNALHFWGPQIRAGDIVRWPYTEVPTAPTDERDLAAAAVRTLCDDGHAGAEYVVTGPQSLTQAEQIRTIGRALGRSLRVEELSLDEARSELLPVLGSPVVVNMLLTAWAAAAGQPAFVSPGFAELTGTSPRTFAEWAADHTGEFGRVQIGKRQ